MEPIRFDIIAGGMQPRYVMIGRPGAHDEEGVLTPRGHVTVERQARRARGVGYTRILTSPARRAQETAAVYASILESGEPIMLDELWSALDRPQGTKREDVASIADLVLHQVAPAVLLVTHGQLLRELTEQFRNDVEYTHPGEFEHGGLAYLDRHTGRGEYWAPQ